MSKKMYLHIGVHKTGTSSLQETLYANREILIKNNIYIPEIKNHSLDFFPLFLEDSSDYFFFREMCNNSNQKCKELASDLVQQWEKIFEKHIKGAVENIIISSEEFEFLDAKGIKKLYDFLSQFYKEINVVVYFREAKSFIASSLQEDIGFGFSSLKDIDEYYFNESHYKDSLQKHIIKLDKITSYIDRNFNYKEMVENYRCYFGKKNIIIRPYDKVYLKNGDIIDDFMDVIAVKDDINLVRKEVNIGSCKKAVYFMSLYNEKYPRIVEGQPNEDRPRFNHKIIFSQLEGEPFTLDDVFTEKQCKRINQNYEYINDIVEGEYQFDLLNYSNKSKLKAYEEIIDVTFYKSLNNKYIQHIDGVNKRIKLLDNRLLKLNYRVGKADEIINHINNMEEGVDDSWAIEDKLFQIYSLNQDKFSVSLRNCFLSIFMKVPETFDENYYLGELKEKKLSCKNAFKHYVQKGAYMGFEPNKKFDTKSYLAKNSNIVLTGENPLIHKNRKDKQMKKILYFHIGAHKTETAVIQKSLYSNRQTLLDHNIYYPAFSETNHGINLYPLFLERPNESNFHKKYYRLNNKEDLEYLKVDLKGKWEEEFELASDLGCDKFIISGEVFDRIDTEKLAPVKEYLLNYFDEIKVIMYINQPNIHFEKFLQHSIKSGSTFEKLTYCLNNEYNYERILKEYIRLFGKDNIIIRPHDVDYFYGGSIIADFLNIVSPREKIIVDKTEVLSKELGNYATIIISDFNKNFPKVINGIKNKDRGQFRGYELFSDIQDDAFNIDLKYDIEQANRINSEIAFINSLLQENYQIGLVKASCDETKLPAINEIPNKVYLEIINEYNKKIEELTKENRKLKVKKGG